MKVIDCEQGSDEWFMHRKGIPTASCFSKIITPAKGELSKSIKPYIALLIAESKFKAPAQWIDILRAVRHGTETEPEARRVYEFMHDTKIEQVGFCTTDDGRYGCSPDGFRDDRKGGLEIKCPNLDTHLGYVMDGCLPNIYKPQVHGSMYVTGCDYWDFMSYAKGEEPFEIRTHRDEYTDKLGNALDSFYKELEAAREKFGVTIKQPIEAAPVDGTVIFGIYEDDRSMDCLMMWSENRVCMLGSRAGECGEGWATTGDDTDRNLPLDTPTHWQPPKQ